jgi:hypothetical protein
MNVCPIAAIVGSTASIILQKELVYIKHKEAEGIINRRETELLVPAMHMNI